MKALGFIETKGLVGNIDATDAMLKAADVEFIGSDTIGAGSDHRDRYRRGGRCQGCYRGWRRGCFPRG